MNISLRHLRAFAAISRAGSFTVAANQLHVSQSALSVLVKDLEDDLGVCLLDRTTRNVRVSEVGLAFLPQVQRILEDLERAIHSIADLRDLKRGVARIAAPQLMSVTLIPSVLAVHRDRFPGVEARIVECLMEEVEAKVASGEADLGVGPERRVGPDVETLPLMKLPVMLVCPKRHPLATAGRVTWSDVVKQPFISQLGAYRALIDLDLDRIARLGRNRRRLGGGRAHRHRQNGDTGQKSVQTHQGLPQVHSSPAFIARPCADCQHGREWGDFQAPSRQLAEKLM